MDEDQRGAPRVDVVPDFCILQTSSGEQFFGIVYNISRTGVLLDVSQNEGRQFQPTENDSLEFLDTPDFLRPALGNVRGRIVRRNSGHWGVQFAKPLALPQAELDRLQDYLEMPEGGEWNKY
ncbi:PilZ domain-containing protein [Desulfonatronum parangueonense]